MPTQTFTTGNDTFVVHTAGTFDLDFLAGDDKLTVQGGTSTTAQMGDGNDTAQLKSGLASVFGGAGSDTFDLWAADATVDGGDDDDLINLRGGSGITASGGLGVDRFNIYADSASVLLHGNDGDDNFFGYFHSVSGSIDGDAGNDYFVQFVGGVSIYGGTGNDIYRADATNPAAFIELTGEGVDSVQVARGASYTLPDNIENISVQGFHGSLLTAATLTGNALGNTINGHNNVETISGLGGDDRLFAKGGDDTVWGGEGNDYLDGGPGNDTLNGENGNDTINGRAGDDTMAGGAGDDTYYVDSLGDDITENSGEGTDLVRVSVSGYTLTANLENGIVSSGIGGAELTGNALDNTLTGNQGNDTLWGGSSGHDILIGGAGSDTLVGGLSATLIGGIGDDTYDVSSGGTVSELPGQGTDTVVIEQFNGGTGGTYILPANVENCDVEISGIDGGAASVMGNELDNILFVVTPDVATIHGGAGNDDITGSGDLGATFYGEAGDDILHSGGDGGEGNDIIYGSGYGGTGTDSLFGSAGNDTLNGGPDADSMSGGLGNDTYYVDDLGDTVDESGGGGADKVYSSLSSYTLGTDIENGEINVGTGATLNGNSLDNVLTGSTGNDTFYGENGVDTIHGGGGDDLIRGGAGADILYGEAGGDTFRYTLNTDSLVASPDQIQDFTSGTDKIDMSAIDANSSVGGDQAFTWTLFPTGSAGQWWFSADGSTPNLYHLFFDINGGGADMKIDVLTTGGGIATTDLIG
jgi:Ca2+-binding RTX toxin-like protein